MTPTRLTAAQKLSALAARFYDRMEWRPRAGDYYTTPRNDLELYQIVSIENGVVSTRYCAPERGDAVSTWAVDEFTAPHTFGVMRTWVPAWVLDRTMTPAAILAECGSRFD